MSKFLEQCYALSEKRKKEHKSNMAKVLKDHKDNVLKNAIASVIGRKWNRRKVNNG